MRAANLLVECLKTQGVSTIFGVPGESYLAVLDALHDEKNSIRFITTRQEGGAGFAADAYAKITGQVGVAFVTRGPGATNASIGVHSAMQNSVPMVLFIGQIGRSMTDKEAFQEVDYRAFFGPLAKWVTQIDDADRIPELVSRAFSVAQSGRPGPVVVALPEDMLRDMTDAKPCQKAKVMRPHAHPLEIEAVADALNGAQRPLLFVGGGAWSDQGRAHLKELAEAWNLPVMTAFRSVDLIDADSSSFVGDMGFGKSQAIRDEIAKADVIVAINLRFGEVETEAWTIFDFSDAGQKLIHIHISPEEINKIYQPSLGIVSCPNDFVSRLGRMDIQPKDPKRARALREAHLREKLPPATLGPVNPAEICKIVDALADPDAIFSTGAGNFAIWPPKFIRMNGLRRLVAPKAGAMGAGLPTAIAAKADKPTREAICFTGDGDFQMTMQEMGTAMQEGLQPIVILLNNGSYGTIRSHQERDYAHRVSATELKNPDFKAIAEAYGFTFARITEDAQFEKAFKAAKTSPTGALIELVTDLRDIAPGRTLNVQG